MLNDTTGRLTVGTLGNLPDSLVPQNKVSICPHYRHGSAVGTLALL